MDEDLPNKFDLVVVGTGFVESAIAAAASRIGKTVFHVDSNDFYGSCWASFSLENIETFLSSSAEANDVLFAKQTWYIPIEDNKSDCTEVNWTQKSVLNNSRKFNIDLVPKLIFSAGKLVDLLISSNICRYAEFRSVDRIFTLFEGNLLNVPCSRTDIFNTKDLTIVEKRLLMKLLTNCISYEIKTEEFAKYQDKTLLEYLKENKLSEKIIHCVMNSIAMCDANTPMNIGMEKMKLYLQSLGKYGNSPFLYPMYGCGEIPQCFCRLCAVFGGIYCLKRKIDVMHLEDEKITLEIDGHVINTDFLVASNAWAHQKNLETNTNTGHQRCGNLARGILITSTTIGNEEQNSGGGGVNVIRLIEGSDTGRAAFLLQLSHYSGTCPKGLYLIHITSEAVSNNPEADLEPFIKQICDESKNDSPKILYATFFLIARCKQCRSGNIQPESNLQKGRIFSTCGPFSEIDYDNSIQNARNIFNNIFPDEYFLPRAPDPEEIIIGDEDPIALTEHCLPDDLKEQINDIEQCVESLELSEGDVAT